MSPHRTQLSTVIDWVELEIRTLAPTNFMTIQAALAVLQDLPEGASLHYVEPLDEGPGRAASVFRFRLQDPKNHRAVVALVAQLVENFPLQCPPIVTGIEVALDTLLPGASARQLAEILADRHRWITHVPACSWHIYRKGGESAPFDSLTRRELIRHLADGWQLSDTPDKSAPLRLHGYVKTSDFLQGRAVQIEPHAWRARLEVTLKGSALPCTTLDQLERFDFATLANYFQFRRPASDHPALAYALRWLHAPAAQHGLPGAHKRRRGVVGRVCGVAKFKTWTRADTGLNEGVYGQLRKLNRSWRGK